MKNVREWKLKTFLEGGKSDMFGLCEMRLKDSETFELNRKKVMKSDLQYDTDGLARESLPFLMEDE